MGLIDLTRSIFGLPPKDKRTHFYKEVDESRTPQEQALRLELATLKAQLSHQSAQKKAETEEEKDKEIEQKVIKDLKEQERNINKDRIGETVSLRRLLQNDNLLKNIDIASYDDKDTFGKFGDILIAKKDGTLIITDENHNPLSRGDEIKDIIFKPDTLANQIKRRRILIPKDSNFNHKIDLENLEVNDVVYDSDTKTWMETDKLKGKVKDLLISRDKKRMRDAEYIERLELAQVNQKAKIDELSRAISVYKNLKENIGTELSQATNLSMQTISQIGEMQRKITNLTEIKVSYELTNNLKDNMINKLLDKIEEFGGSSAREIIQAEVYGNLEKAKKLLPETIIEQKEEPKEPIHLPNPNEVISNRRDI